MTSDYNLPTKMNVKSKAKLRKSDVSYGPLYLVCIKVFRFPLAYLSNCKQKQMVFKMILKNNFH